MKLQGDLLTAAEACNILGIKAQTLYAYVSRGLIQVQAAKDRRESLYPRDQIEALRVRSHARSGHGPAAASAMRFGDPILESAITLIQNQQIYYRGYALTQLIADELEFEGVAELLWSGVLTRSNTTWSKSDSKSEQKAERTTDKKRPPKRVDLTPDLSRMFLYETARLAMEDADQGDESIDLAITRGRTLIKHAARSLSMTKTTASGTTIARILANAVDQDPELTIPMINHALMVSADHELNASTFAARIAASTGADLYSCIMAGLGAFSGPKHGVSPVYVHGFFTECVHTHRIKDVLRSYLRRKKNIPGFGHPLYLSSGDPRAHILLESLRSQRSKLTKSRRNKLDQVEEFLGSAQEADVGFPNLDLGLTALVFVLDLPATWCAGLFAIGRMAGWTAHILEQRQQEFLLRPRARYTGRPIQ